MANLNDFAARFRKGISSPFTSDGNRRYCLTCKMDVDCELAAAHRGTTFVFRRRCRRCGTVIERGVNDNVVLVTGQWNAAAVAWTHAPGEDRR